MPIPRRPVFALVALLLPGLAACAQFPDLQDTRTEAARRAPYPELVPAETLRAGLPDTRIAPETEQTLEVRVAGLRARAARLRGRVLDSASRSRLSQPVAIADET